jgi:hypothetical protein
VNAAAAGFLPTGWEMGYNHFVGRLGMKMPETAALLARSWPEWQVRQQAACMQLQLQLLSI